MFSQLKQKKCLLVAYGGGHVAMLASVYTQLVEQGYDVVFLALTTAQQYLQQIDIPYIGFKDIPCKRRSEVEAYGQRLLDNLPAGGSVSKEESIYYLGWSFLDLVDQLGEVEAEKYYSHKGRQAFLPLSALKAAITWTQPDVVVATNSPRAERAAILSAGELGIPAVCLVDLFAIQETQWIGQPNYANRVCVLNEAVKQRILSFGRTEEEVIVTGNPAFDRLHLDEIKAAGLALRQARNWDDGLVTLLWASQVEPEQHPFASRRGDPLLPRKVEAILRKFVEAHSDFRLVVRYHPSEQIEFVDQERVIFSPVSENLHMLLHAVDLVVVTASTVGLEASLIGKPVLSVDCSIITADVSYATMGISQGVDSPDALPAAITVLQQQGQFAKAAFQEAYFQKAMKNATGISSVHKIVNVIESLLKTHEEH